MGDMYGTIVRFFQEGGIFMYPIILVFSIGLAIAIERYMFLSSAGSSNRKAWQSLLPHLQKGDFSQALSMAKTSGSIIARILVYGLSISSADRRRDDIEMAMDEGMLQAIPRLEKRTHYLSTLANVSTLLGLLGTIVGLIRAFTAVSNADPAEKADLLSASISVAMNTTAFGLMAAIPLLLCHSLLRTKTTEIIDNLEMASVSFLNIVGETIHRSKTAENSRSQ